MENKRRKKIAVIGRGTAGSLAASEMLREFRDQADIEWHFDSSVKTQAVGEGSALPFARSLFNNLGFTHHDLHKIDGTFKHGIRKMNWSHKNPDFYHEFPSPFVSYHFNAVSLQNYVFEQIKDQVKIVDHNVTYDQIDADYTIDCSGKPTDFSLFEESEFIPVNAAYVTQCYWEYPRFLYTLTMARPWGWVFGIPLQNRCSIGYMFNDKITSLEQVKEDVKNVFDQFNLTPSTTTNELHFRNYYRKTNFIKNVAFNGNASFFLEPLEATTLSGVYQVNNWAIDIINDPLTLAKKNHMYKNRMAHTENIIMLHYLAGSTFKNEFWDYAEERARRCLEKGLRDPDWRMVYEVSKTHNPLNQVPSVNRMNELLALKKWQGKHTDDWEAWNYYQNLSKHSLDLYDKIDSLREI
jgi:hypothetical protein